MAKASKPSPANQMNNQPNPYGTALWWVLFSLLIMWCTTEISQKVYFDDLLFWLTLGAAYYLGRANDFANNRGRIKASKPKI